MKRKYVKSYTICLVCGFLCYASQSIGENYRFTQGGFSGGGNIAINFSGEDKNGGIDGLNGNFKNPDSKIGFFDCRGNRPACGTYHVDKFDKEMALNFVLSGSPLFQRANAALAKLQKHNFDEVGFFDLDTNEFFLEINLGNFGAPLYEFKFTKDNSSVCEYTYDTNFNRAKQCETSSQPALISGPPAYITFTPGSAASVQPPSTLQLTVTGLKSDINVPASNHKIGGGWIQVPLTTPVVTSGTVLKLVTIAINYDAPLKSVGGSESDAYYERAIIDQVNILDSGQALFSRAIVPWPSNEDLFRNKEKGNIGLGSNMRETITLPSDIRIHGDLIVLLHIVNQCIRNAACTAQKMTLNKVMVGFNP